MIIIVLIIFIIILILKNKYNEYFNNINLKFIHIPKNAGTSIENLGNKYGIKWGKYDNIHVYKQLYAYNWHSPYFIKEKNTHYFAIIRNPYDRIISVFYYNANKHINNINNLNSHIISFNNWFDMILTKEDEWYGCHILPQYNYIYRNNKKIVENIIYMDNNFKINLDKLFKKYGLNIDINDFKKENDNRYPVKLKPYDLSQNTLDKIYNKYKIDFDTFGYKRIIL